MNAKQELINYDDNSMIQTLKQTVAQGLTDAEFRLFVEYCKATGLNALKKEIWAIKAGGRLQLMTSAAGLFTIANSNPVFDGFESGLVGPDGELVSGAYPKDDYIGAWCRVHRKDRKVPTEAIAMLSEYDKNQGNWKTMRRTMIIKCAESVGMRKTFPQELNGIYSSEEMPVQFAPDQAPSALPPSKVKPSVQIEEHIEKPIYNILQEQTLQAIEEKESWIYDGHGIGNTTPKEERKGLGPKLKELGVIQVDKIIHSAKELPEYQKFLIEQPQSQLDLQAKMGELTETQDDFDFSKESEELASKKYEK